MPTLKINFATDKFVSDFAPVPAGEYRAVIDRVLVREGGESKADYMSADFTLLDEDFSGRKVTRQLLLSMKGADEDISKVGWAIQNILESLCVDVEETGFDFGYDPETHEYEGFVIVPTDEEGVREWLGIELPDGSFIPFAGQVVEVKLKVRKNKEFGDQNNLSSWVIADPSEMIIQDEVPGVAGAEGRSDDLV